MRPIPITPARSSDKGPSWVAGVVNAIGESQYWRLDGDRRALGRLGWLVRQRRAAAARFRRSGHSRAMHHHLAVRKNRIRFAHAVRVRQRSASLSRKRLRSRRSGRLPAATPIRVRTASGTASISSRNREPSNRFRRRILRRTSSRSPDPASTAGYGVAALTRLAGDVTTAHTVVVCVSCRSDVPSLAVVVGFGTAIALRDGNEEYVCLRASEEARIVVGKFERTRPRRKHVDRS